MEERSVKKFLEQMPCGKQKRKWEIQEGKTLDVWLIKGARNGKTLVLTAGVHGCEYVGILSLPSLFTEISAEDLQGNILMLPLLNPGAFYEGAKQVMPEDGENLNRVFPGNAEGTYSRKLAKWIEEEIYPAADFILDLHGGDIQEDMLPLVFFPAEAAEEVSRFAEEGARRLLVNYRLASRSRNGLYSYAALQGIPGLLLEIGGRGTYRAEDIALCKACIYRMLAYLGICGEDICNEKQKKSESSFYIEAIDSGFWFIRVQAGEAIEKGQLLGEVKNTEEEVLQAVYAEESGMVWYSTRVPGVKQGDPLIAYGKI